MSESGKFPTCETCGYYCPDGLRRRGWCQRHPPVVVPDQRDEDGKGFFSAWPEVSVDDWCGDYHRDPVNLKVQP